MQIRPFKSGDEQALIKLWRRCGLVRPPNDPLCDIRRKVTSGNGWLLVGESGGHLVASVMVGYEGHRGWLNYVAVDPDFQRRGFARALLAEAEKLLVRVGCPKINLQIRAANHHVAAFYRHLGYSTDEVMSMGKRLVSDEPQASTWDDELPARHATKKPEKE